MAINVESFMVQLLASLNITAGINIGLTIALFFLVLVAEVNILVPLLIESLWLAVGYQFGTNVLSVLNTIFLFILAQIARQMGTIAVYYLLALIKSPISKLNMSPLQSNYFCRKYMENQYLREIQFLSILPVTLGMMSPLSAPLKIILALKRKPKMLLTGTLLSGAIFDAVYVLLGAVFHATALAPTYLPIFMLAGFLAFTLLKLVNRKKQDVLR